MIPFLWHQAGEGRYEGQTGALQITCQPPRGLQLTHERLRIPAVLAIEIVSAAGLPAQQLVTWGNKPEIVIRQESLFVKYRPAETQNIECDVRWRISPEGSLDLEVSALTPGNWENVGIQTCSVLPAGEVILLDDVTPPIFVWRPEQNEVSYVEFCHPEDGMALDQESLTNGGTVLRYKLFGHDLEKGVILRGRLRGRLVPRSEDVTAARSAYQDFLKAPPHLSF